MVEFVKWSSTARLFRDVTITEKLDGTNACVIFERVNTPDLADLIGKEMESLLPNRALRVFNDDGIQYAVYAQSRNRLITPSSDNAGFAKWVEQNYQQIFYVLGEGRHYGEWWGQGIGRKYDMTEKVFSIFNTASWYKLDKAEGSRSTRARLTDINIDVVPVLFQGMFSEEIIREYANQLRLCGSEATSRYTGERFSNPEGICIYHKGADTVFKYTFDSNDKHKWEFETPTIKRTFMDKMLRRK